MIGGRLFDEAGYGNLIFDGWDDINSEPVVNVLLRTESTLKSERRYFFLESLYPGMTSMTAKQCQ